VIAVTDTKLTTTKALEIVMAVLLLEDELTTLTCDLAMVSSEMSMLKSSIVAKEQHLATLNFHFTESKILLLCRESEWREHRKGKENNLHGRNVTLQVI
jgi:hypothetical protein